MITKQLDLNNIAVNNQSINKQQYFNLCNIAINYMIADDSPVKFYEILENINFNCFEPKQNMKFIESILKNKAFDLNLNKLNFNNLPLTKEQNSLKLCDLMLKYNYSLEYVNPLLLPKENRNEIYLDICTKFLNKEKHNFQYIEGDYLPEPITENYKNLCLQYIQSFKNSYVSLWVIKAKYLNREDYLNFFTKFDRSIRELDVNSINPQIREQFYLQYCSQRIDKYAYEFQFVKFVFLPSQNAKQHYFKLAQQALNNFECVSSKKQDWHSDNDDVDNLFRSINPEYLPDEENYYQLYNIARNKNLVRLEILLKSNFCHQKCMLMFVLK